jgi:hypothetical protein
MAAGIGYFSGQAALDDGRALRLDDLPGFAEEMRNRWQAGSPDF